MNENQEHQTMNDPLEQYIDGTLRRDAESLRARFEAVPSGRLTSRLALQTATRGMFRSIGTKFAMYAGAAAIVAGVLYWMPKKTVEPPLPPKSEAPPAIVTHDTAQQAKVLNKSVTVEKPRLTPQGTEHLKTLKLDDSDTGKIPTYTDSNYKDPLK